MGRARCACVAAAHQQHQPAKVEHARDEARAHTLVHGVAANVNRTLGLTVNPPPPAPLPTLILSKPQARLRRDMRSSWYEVRAFNPIAGQAHVVILVRKEGPTHVTSAPSSKNSGHVAPRKTLAAPTRGWAHLSSTPVALQRNKHKRKRTHAFEFIKKTKEARAVFVFFC